MDEDGTVLKDKMRIHEPWTGYIGTLLNMRSPKLDPALSDLLLQQPLASSLGSGLTMDEVTALNRGMPN